MRALLIGTCAAVVVAGSLVLPTSVSAAPSPRIGTGGQTCVLARNADCSDVVDKWRVEHHGNLTGVTLARARLQGADFRGAILDRADLRGVVLRHAQLQDAHLQGADFSPVPKRGPVPAVGSAAGRARPRTETNPLPCGNSCQGADLTGANLVDANLRGANLSGANLTGANLFGASLENANLLNANFSNATLTNAVLSQATVIGTNFTGANLSGTNFTGAFWGSTTCPNGTVTNSGC